MAEAGGSEISVRVKRLEPESEYVLRVAPQVCVCVCVRCCPPLGARGKRRKAADTASLRGALRAVR